MLALSGLAILLSVAMASWATFGRDNNLWFEIGKLVAQFGILTGFGAIVTVLVNEFQREREAAQKRIDEKALRDRARQDWLRSILQRTVSAYVSVKQERRALQVATSQGKYARKSCAQRPTTCTLETSANYKVTSRCLRLRSGSIIQASRCRLPTTFM
jgi:hypothetical protein